MTKKQKVAQLLLKSEKQLTLLVELAGSFVAHEMEVPDYFGEALGRVKVRFDQLDALSRALATSRTVRGFEDALIRVRNDERRIAALIARLAMELE